MQFPNVTVRGAGGCQQFSDVYYGRLLGLIEKEDKLVFKQDGRSRFAHFISYPLPLTPPNTRTPYDLTRFEQPDEVLPPGRKFNIYHQLLYFYSNHTDVHLPISVATELLPPTRPTISKNPNYSKYKIEFSKARTRSASYPTASDSAKPSDHPSCCSIVAQLDDLLLWACGPDQKTLGVARLSFVSTIFQESDSFLSWSRCHSPLPFTPLQALSMPAQIRHIQTAKINKIGYVGVRCDYYVCVLLVSEGGLEAVKVHQTQHLITLSAFSPYVPEEFVVFTEPGGLCLISPVSNITQITTPLHPQALCFGPHPRSVIIAVDSTVHKIDWRTFPVSTCILYEAKQRITCMSHDPAHLFSVFMCTRNHLLAIDLREPGRLVLSVLLEITRPPFFITFTSSHEETLLMLVSWMECTVVGVSKSPPLRTTTRPHLVMNFKVMHNRLMAAGLPCEGRLCHVTYRLTRPIIGAALWFADSTYASIIATDLGDVFHQSWTYEDTPTSSAEYILSASSCHGYNLWLEEAFTQEKELAEYHEILPTGGRPFMRSSASNCVMDYIVSPETPPTRLCVRCHFMFTLGCRIDPSHHMSTRATTPAHCTFCGGLIDLVKTEKSRHADSVASAMEELRKVIPPPHEADDIDSTLLHGWTD
ncbi:uncharacterized protein LOC135341273 [Halichondria panicea]|uniref:uncharacterized protein LOC135341273 n=1 Tax=Halichondria panicea TaxID=6063 RepID=UPI00312B78FB